MIDQIIDLVGDRDALALGGAIIGVLFGALAQRSRFCLRAATLEVAHGDVGERLAIWLFAFSTALIATQALILLGLFDAGTVRQLNNRGSLSGSIIGGLMFGCGMTFTRACGSRMLVLAATGNLRALLSGLVFAVVAQMSHSGALSPLRTAINDWWTIDASSRDMFQREATARQVTTVWLGCRITRIIHNGWARQFNEPIPVCTENSICVDEVTESRKLVG